MLIAQISDCHVVPSDTAKGKLMATEEYLERAVSHVLALDPRPDAAILTGDLVDDGSVAEYDLLIEILAPLQKEIPVYVIPGNHDDRDVMRERMRGAGYDHLPEAGPLRYAVDLGELRLVALDTVIPGEPGGALSDDALAWLDERLAEEAKPTLIMQHHPPFATGLAHMDGMSLEAPERQASIVAKHGHVLRVLCGHLHRSIASEFAGTLAMTAPSCAHAVELDLRHEGRLAVVREPPALLLHLWRDGSLVTHTSYIGDFGAPYVIAE